MPAPPLPDEFANEADLPPPDPQALTLIGHIRGAGRDADDAQAVRDTIAREPGLINMRGTDGATPLMYAALYGDIELLRSMLAAGGDPNLRNDSNATALMWAVEDIEKVKLLLTAGADVNAVSGFGRTPLALASLQANSAPLVQLLLARGAKPTPLSLSAAARGGEGTVRLLMAAGAKDKGDAAGNALRFQCLACLDALLPGPGKLPRGLLDVLPPNGPGVPGMTQTVLDRGADVNARDNKERSPLMLATLAEGVSPRIVQGLIDRGADVHVKSAEGLNALDYAQRMQRAPIIAILRRAGAQPTQPLPTAPKFVPDNSPSAAIERALPLLQRSSQQFYARSGCVGCHHSLQTADTVQQARRAGFHVDESLAQEDLRLLTRDITVMREQALEGIVIPGGGATSTGYILLTLAAQNYPPDEATDSLVRLIRLLQREDGRWLTTTRPPIEASEFTATALSVLGLRKYGAADPGTNEPVITRAAKWLASSTPRNHEDRVYRLRGMLWANPLSAQRGAALRELLATQRSDGGWAQTDFRASDAFATGEALVALREAGMTQNDRAYKRGIRYLLSTQLADGSWLVHTRSPATQSPFDSGFPHGVDQFISAAATNWATQALLQSLPPPRVAQSARARYSNR